MDRTRSKFSRRDEKGQPQSPLKDPVWPHKSLLDWMDQQYPEIHDPRNLTDREVLIRIAKRSVYLDLLRHSVEE